MDIAGFLEQYPGLSDLTRKAYKNTLEMLERRLLVAEPTDDDVREFLREFKKGTTLQRHKAAIRRYFIYKRRAWLFDSKEFIPARKKLPKYHPREVVDKLIAATADEHDRMFIKTLFMGGLRISELMGITADNIARNGITVLGKGSKERFVPIADKIFMEELKSYARGKSGKLFPKRYYDYWLLLRRLCLEAGVAMVSPHTLRHSRAVDLLNRGVPLGGLQTFLGHQQPATTLIYAQLTQSDLQKALEKVEG